MNSIAGKSTGIALLMAAALLAALFSMGVFSANGVGADEHITATAELIDLDRDETASTTDADTLRISLDGLTRVSQSGSNEVVITMNDDLDQQADTTAVAWGGGDQYSSSGTLGAYDTPTGGYTTALEAFSIEVGVAMLDIELEADNSVDTNTTITAITVGRTGANTLLTVAIPEAGLAITGAPDGPSTTLEPASVPINPGATSSDPDVDVTLEGSNFDDDSSAGGVSFTVTDAAGAAVLGAALPTAVAADALVDGGFDVTVGIPAEITAEAQEITITATQDGDAVSATFTVNPPPPPSPAEVTLSSYTPSAAVQITITANAAARIRPNQDITVDLDPFAVPSTIADSSIDISSEGFNGSPTNVLVTGKKVTMTVPRPDSDDTNSADDVVVDNYTIRIKQSAGVTNPASGGEKTVKWVENAPNAAEAANKEAKVTIQRVVKVSEDEGTRGTESTATLLGFADGTATVNLNGDKLAEVTITDNTGTLELDTSSSTYEANRDGGNVITAEDAAGNEQDVSATFTIEPSLSLDPTETVVSKSVSLSLSDWPGDEDIESVQIGATEDIALPDSSTDSGHQDPSTDDDGAATFSVTIPEDVNRGSQTVKVTGVDGSTASATLQVGVLPLDVSPSSAVPGQEITIQGSGFDDGDDLTSLTIGGKTVAIPDNNDEASSNGDVVITVRVPSPTDDAIGNGTKKIVLMASGSGRVAEGEVEVPEASITLSPMESRRGTTVSVTGSGFPSGDLVQVQYDNDGSFVTVTAKAADSAGSVSLDFVVPSYADIGSEHDVQAMSVGVYGPVTASATHSTPGAMVTLTPDRVPNGSQLTIAGMNFPAFATVAEMTVGGVDVRPVPAPATSIDGDFSATVLVPQMELGNQSVSVRVAQTTFTTFLEIVPATTEAVTDPEEVFAGLGDRLIRVWYLDRATQLWNFYDPDPVVAAFNDLTEVSSGQNVTIMISPGGTIEFQGITLYAGTNPIALD